MRKQGWSLWLGSVLILGGAVLLGWYSWMLHERHRAQRLAKEWLNRAVVVHRPAPGPLVRHGDVIGQLEIPRLRVSVMVFEGDDDVVLGVGAGHISDTALPAGSGNIGIAAHRDTYFRPLGIIQPKDLLTLSTPAGTLRYSVTETKIVRPSDVEVLANAPGRDLTLVTCYPFYYVGSAPERFIVHARKIG